MTRRDWLGIFSALGLAGAASAQRKTDVPAPGAPKVEPLVLTDAQWKQRLTPAQYQVLREEGTERAFTSPLNDEKRKGTFHCAGCDLPLFSSATKYDSGTGWPSFHSTLPGAVGTKRDFKMLLPRVEYHCVRCGGHQGHVFEDGPKPTGLRYCNNGVALKFVPEAA
jgi:peptide-methionine (R)-S-oxide reductase